MSITLSDAISHYHSLAEATHRFWAYFQFMAAGAVTVAWTQCHVAGLDRLVAIGFLVFAIGNLRLVWDSQRQMNVVAASVRSSAVTGTPSIPIELASIPETLRPDPVFWTVAAHVGLSCAVLVAIWLAPYSAP